MKILSDEEAFFIHHMKDQQYALYLFATLQKLPGTQAPSAHLSPDSSVCTSNYTTQLQCLIIAMMDLFDYLLLQKCAYCEVAKLMPPGGRVLRCWFIKENITSARILQAVQLEMKILSQEVSSHAWQSFSCYFIEKRHENYKALYRYVYGTPREVVHLPASIFAPPPIVSPQPRNSIDGLEIELQKYKAVCEDSEVERDKQLVKIKMSLRNDWENMERNLAFSRLDDDPRTVHKAVEDESAVFGITMDNEVSAFPVEFIYETDLAQIQQKLDKSMNKSTSTEPAIVAPVLEDKTPPEYVDYPSLVPTKWEPKKQKITKHK